MKDKRVGIITQARMGSTRLLKKVLLEIKGKPLLQYHVERLLRSGLPVYIATTDKSGDDEIADFAKNLNIPFFRGSEEDVLGRFYHCAKENELEVIIRVTSDNPLVDGTIIKQALDEYLGFDSGNVHHSNHVERTYPIGSNFEIFSFDLLKDAHEKAETEFDRENVTPYIIQNKSGNVLLRHFKRSESGASEYRLTVDYPDDFLLIRILVEKFGADEKNVEEIIKIYEENPWLVNVNIPEKAQSWGDGTRGK